jgi:hypothetical protein
MQNLYETDSDRSSIELQTSEKKVAILREMYNGKSDDSSSLNTTRFPNQEHFNCKICSDNTSKNFLILSCNHIFHIKCLAESHFKDIYEFPIIDSEYFDSRTCPCCDEQLQTEELMYLHGKFLSGTKKLISKHQNSIEHLESQLKQIKNELRTCYDYKHKMEKESEKSKQIVSVLTTMM